MTTVQKIILTITILIYSSFTLFLIGVSLSQINTLFTPTCQEYDYSKLDHNLNMPCLRYGSPPIGGVLIIWLVGTVITFLVIAPIYAIWGKNKSRQQSNP